MALPTVKEVVTGVSASTGAGVTINTSSAVTTDDFLVLYHTVPGHTGTKPTPSGGGTWTGQIESNNTPSDKFWTRPVVSSGVQTVTVAGVTSRRQSLTLLVLSVVDLTAPVNATGKSGFTIDWTSNHWSANLNTTADSCLVICGWQAQDSGSYSGTLPAGMTAQSLLDVNGPDARVATFTKSSPGPVGTKTISYSTASPWETLTIAVKGKPTTTHQASVAFAATSTFAPSATRVHPASVAFDVESTFDPEGVARVPQTIQAEVAFQLNSSLLARPSYSPPTPAELARIRRAVRTIPVPRVRFYAQKITTGEWLDTDVELTDPQITYTLSGPGQLTAKITPEQRRYQQDDGSPRFEAYGTWIHVEEAGEIRGSYVVQPFTSDTSLTLKAEGFSGVPYGQPYVGSYQGPDIGTDPAVAFRAVWQDVLDSATGQGRSWGITVDQAVTGVLINTPQPQPDVNDEPQPDKPNPYILAWYNGTDCGQELDKLAKAAPFDYVEEASWKPDKSGTLRNIRIGYPRVGRRRSDLRFASGENIRNVVTIMEDPEAFATEVILIGAGDGSDTVIGRASYVHPTRMPKRLVVTDKTVSDKVQADLLATQELNRRKALLLVQSVDVQLSHSNAPYGSYQVGDDILLTLAGQPWAPDPMAPLLHRIVEITVKPLEDVATLTLKRAESFTYRAAS